MPHPPLRQNFDAAALWRSGAQALRAGDAVGALAAFQRIVQAGGADATVWLGVALASGRVGDPGGQLAALDRVLAIEPRNMRALMMKGDHYVAAGDLLASTAFYRAVVSLGEATTNLPSDLAAEVARARAACDEAGLTYEAHIHNALAVHKLGEPGTRRMAASVDLLLGKTVLYPQQPTQYYFPELPQIQFYEREQTPWLSQVEAAAEDIRAELIDILKQEGVFAPYVEPEPNRPFFDQMGLSGDPSWSAFFLWQNGAPVADHADRCPKTMAALAQTPMFSIPGRAPSILFSLLRPGARIPPHTGLLNTRLICHLPLITPPGCTFRVGCETRTWEQGRAWAFDDSIEHEAYNSSDQIRVVLIFDVWRPELTSLERDMVSSLLGAIDGFGKTRPGLGI